MTIGYFLITVAFIAAIVSATAYILYYKEKQEPLLRLGNQSFVVMGISIATSLAMLIYSILTHNFQINYVYNYSSTALNKFYLFSTLWAGQEGTFMLWLFYGVIYGFILIKITARKRPLVMFFLLLVQVFLLLILLKKNPFAMIWHAHEQVPVGFMPSDGAGLNPLLQNNWMVIHPPTLFLGYSSTVVPFAFAMAAMVSRNFQGWIKEARPWVIFNVMILGTGIIMGGYWAYTTLGWGGYWGWDPVENASLVPWIFGLALLHGLIIQAKRQALVKTNFFLAGTVFLTMIWGSFLTRSGVLTDFSVHSFGASGLNLYLMIFQGLFTLLFLGVFFNAISYYKKIEEEPIRFGDGLLNRETFILAGMLTLVLTGLFVLFGTSSPIYTSWFGDPASLSPDFYNTMITPVVIAMLIVISIAPLLAWKTSELRNVSTILWSAAGALLLTLLAFFVGLTHLLSIVLFFLAAFVIIVNLKVTFLFLKRNFGNAGGYLAHVGIGFMVIGILTSSLYDSSEKIMLPQGEFKKTGLGQELKFLHFVEMPDGRDRVKVRVKTNNTTYDAYPQFYYSDYSESYMVSPDVKVQFAKDIYISPISFTPAQFANQNVIQLSKMETKTFRDMRITFNKFLVKMGGAGQEVTADLTVMVKENSYPQEYHIAPMIKASQGEMVGNEVQVPNTPYRVKINSVSANEGTVELAIMAPQKDGESPKDVLAVEVSEKPLISILWFGTIIFVAGTFITLVHRARKKDYV